jgi:DNA-directed RNA polymerase specialized sigma24 family protein
LNELDRFDAQQARIVELRFFGGLSIDETSRVLQISPATLKARLGDGTCLALSGSGPDLGMG